jgi:hypothetical protein
MAICSKCGAVIPEGVKFCTVCGAPMLATATAQPAQPTAVAAPAAPQPEEIKEAPISTGGWFGIMFLLALPAINILLLIIWAVGGTGNTNKRNFSRAALLWMLIGGILSLLIGVIISIFFAGNGGLDGIKELVLDKITGSGLE